MGDCTWYSHRHRGSGIYRHRCALVSRDHDLVSSRPLQRKLATLVEGPNDAHLAYNNQQLSMTLDIQCGINNGLAACTGDAGYDITPLVFPTTPAQPFLVQGGGGPVTASSTSSQSSALPSPSPASSAPSAVNSAASSKSANNGSSNVVVQIYLGLLCAAGVVALVLS